VDSTAGTVRVFLPGTWPSSTRLCNKWLKASTRLSS